MVVPTNSREITVSQRPLRFWGADFPSHSHRPPALLKAASLTDCGKAKDPPLRSCGDNIGRPMLAA